MIYHPHFESYSIPARICLGIGIFGAALLAATVLTDELAASCFSIIGIGNSNCCAKPNRFATLASY
jgi:hypothetical protein